MTTMQEAREMNTQSGIDFQGTGKEEAEKQRKQQEWAAYMAGPDYARWRRLQRRFDHGFTTTVNQSKTIMDFARMLLTTAIMIGLFFYVLVIAQEPQPAKEPSTEAMLLGGLLMLATVVATGLLGLLTAIPTWKASSLLAKNVACEWAINMMAEFNPRKAANAIVPFVAMGILHAVVMMGIVGAVLLLALRAMKA
jgi:hypothetical protein